MIYKIKKIRCTFALDLQRYTFFRDWQNKRTNFIKVNRRPIVRRTACYACLAIEKACVYEVIYSAGSMVTSTWLPAFSSSLTKVQMLSTV